MSFGGGDPQALWLNVTNAALGLVTLVCFGVLAYAVVREVAERVRARALAGDAHAHRVPELGLVMADGGDPERDSKKPSKPEETERP